MPTRNAFKRFVQKMRHRRILGEILDENRGRRPTDIPSEELMRIGGATSRSRKRPAEVAVGRSMADFKQWIEKIAIYETGKAIAIEKGTKIVRKGAQKKLNKSRPRGKRSPYKLTGLGNSDARATLKWNQEIRKRLADMSIFRSPEAGRFLAERAMAEQWERLPDARKKEMLAWMKKNGRAK
ncbi:MAG: hypothetical protein Q8P05_04695 [Candidatus Diapherotrites archaeon]|nr:hypothetical protein [Candidatus Diapherotrites archaeon]MDZ4256643.1 hypothetical protein [archaeon]